MPIRNPSDRWDSLGRDGTPRSGLHGAPPAKLGVRKESHPIQSIQQLSETALRGTDPRATGRPLFASG
jgi:hypothetical protein